MSSAYLRAALLVVAAASLAASPGDAQSTQSLPNGFLTTSPNSGSAFPFNNANSHVWQWHYDSAQFAALGQITITEVYVRGLNNAPIPNAFNFPSVELVMASSPTSYTVLASGATPGHSTTLAANLNPDATVVRPAAPWTGGPQTTGGWIPMGMVVPFTYNPSSGNDFVLQIRKCGSTVAWGVSIDGKSGTAGANGGNRYGDSANCAATVSTFSNNEYVPVIKIDYLEYNILAISQSGPGVGDLSVSLTNISPTATEAWTLLSADVSGAVNTGPLLGLRPTVVTFSILTDFPILDGNPFHHPIPSMFGFYPNSPFNVGPGGVSVLAGNTFDIVVYLVRPGYVYDSRSNLVRFLFQ